MVDKNSCQLDQHLIVSRVFSYQIFQKWQSFQAFALGKECLCLLLFGLIRRYRIRLRHRRRQSNPQTQEQNKNKASPSVRSHGSLLSRD